MSALLVICAISFFIPWNNVWIALRWMVGDTTNIESETVLDSGLVVQEVAHLSDEGSKPGFYDRELKVFRHGSEVYSEELMTSAQQLFFKDMNGNGSIDFHFYDGAGGNGGYSNSYIFDPLYEKIYALETGEFRDLNGDGTLEFLERDLSLSYRWDVCGVDDPRIFVICSWDPIYGEFHGWQVDREMNRKDPPNQKAFEQQVCDIIECSVTRSNKPNQLDVGCFLEEVLEYCYTSHPKLAFKLLDEVWTGSDTNRITFEEKFVEILRHSSNVTLLAKFGFFD